MKRSIFWKGILVSLAVALLPAIGGSTAYAGDLYPRGVHPLFLLSSANVRAELNLSEEQAAEIDEISADFVRGSAVATDVLNDPATSVSREEAAAIYADLEADFAASGRAVLTEAQLRRLDQIDLQIRGATALFEGRVTVPLGMSDDDFDNMLEAVRPFEEFSQEAVGLGRFGELSLAQVSVMVEDGDAWAKGAAIAVLSDDQRAALGELEGEPIDFEIGPLRLRAKIDE
jgi:hypothetical protein